jgi:CheY-like chemotaxis protein
VKEELSPVDRKTILLVEDEPALLRMTQRVLERNGFEVLTATTGQEALDAWEQANGNVDLLLTDVVLPDGMSGILLAGKLLAKRPALRVICTSGYSSEILGDDVPMPFQPEELIRFVRQIIEAKDARSS